jgi:toxin ParE1/3/4
MRIRYTVRASADLATIYSYLDERSPAGARAVKAQIERRISLLADFPYIAPRTDEPGVHELTLVRYPYKVYYQVEGDDVWIVHIRHAARRPWQAGR